MAATCRMCNSYSSSTATSRSLRVSPWLTNTPETTRVMGTHGVLEIVENTLTYTPQLGTDTGPSYYAGSFPRPAREQ